MIYIIKIFYLKKQISRNGFVLELSLEDGRYLGGDDGFSPEGFIRRGISF